jgi:serine/threonine protein kinase
MIAPAGRRLGKYEIRQKLGRGGMADVYLAQDTEANAPVALKLIEHGEDADSREFIEAERRGAGLQASLAAIDPHVARVFDCGDLDGYFFVAMEYVDGQDLAELMRRGKLEVEFAADVAIAVGRTLENAHNLDVVIEGKGYRGIVHGDIKPKNIRIDSRGEVRVLDFGIAKALSLSRRLTRNEFGSVPYASPERLDSGEVDAQSDLWSLAVMLYEMLTGLQPYHSATTEQLERMIRSRIPPPPAPDPCPEPLRRVLAKCMAPDPESRYASAHEFAADLAAFRAGERTQAESEDLDATRRTSRREAPENDATRRTAPREAGASDETRVTARPAGGEQPVDWPPRDARQRRGRFGKAMRVAAVLAGAALLYLLWTVASDWRLYSRGKDFQRQVETERLTDPDQIWKRWTELSKGHSSSWLLQGPRGAARQRFVEAAERVIAAYRNDAQQLREGDWRRARNNLSHALEMEPDKTTRGELRLCEGHLARINGTVHNDAAALNVAVQNFQEAQSLLPKSPDPQLGLARAYIYGLKDVDKANSALNQAGRLGYTLSNRDLSQLADGYRYRAESLWAESRDVRGLPQERDQVTRAEQDYRTALNLYQRIAPCCDANTQIVRIQISLDNVHLRLQQLDEAPPQPGKSAEAPQRSLVWRILSSALKSRSPQCP